MIRIVNFDPEIHKKVRGGGFVLASAYNELRRFQYRTASHDCSDRESGKISFLKFWFGKGRDPIDLLQEKAIEENQKFDEIRHAEAVRKSMPPNLLEKLSSVKFKGKETTSYHGEWNIEAIGLHEAIRFAAATGSSVNYDDDWMNTSLIYEDEDTRACVYGHTNGWGSPRPFVIINHKGLEYKWTVR